MSDKCRACQAEIIWIRTKNGNTMPVNAEPIWVKLQTGGDTFVQMDGTIVFGVPAGDADDDPDSNCVEAHTSHFATCPEAYSFRKSRKPRTPRVRPNRTPFY